MIKDMGKSDNNIYEDIRLLKDSIKKFFMMNLKGGDKEKISISDFFKNLKKDFPIREKGDTLDIFDLFYLFGVLHQKHLEFADYLSIKADNYSAFNIRKTGGSFYTHYSIAYYIVKKCFEDRFKQNGAIDLKHLNVLEPCVGTGIFIIALIDFLCGEIDFTANHHNRKEFVNFIENSVYCVDIDREALELFKTYLPLHLKEFYNIEIDLSKLGSNIKRADTILDSKLIEDFKDKFDIIFFNPPYELLKPNSSEFRESDGKISSVKFMNHKVKTDDIKKFIKESGVYKYSLQGMLNLYKLFIELTCDVFSKPTAQIGFIVPFTLLGDYQCKDLRRDLIYNHSISSISIIPEKNDFFGDITQAFCIVNICNGTRTSIISLKNNVKKVDDLFNGQKIEFDYSLIKSVSSTDVIFPLSKLDISILNKIHKYKNLGDLREYFGNFRGEIDLTKYKEFITEKKTQYPLVRGKNIGYFNDINRVVKEEEMSYLHRFQEVIKLLSQTGKVKHYRNKRIACQQISNMKTPKRIRFSIIPQDFLLANSCNYLVIKQGDLLDREYGINYLTLLCLLNSSIYDWRFKLTSTNNHISNNELDDLPIPIDKNRRWIFLNLQNICKKYINDYINLDKLESSIDGHVSKLFNLSSNEIKHLLKKNRKENKYIDQVINIFNKLHTSYIYNHQISSLSKLDMEMIWHVPPGGNWKNIPESIPSKRLEQIRRTGGRTTLYGRMRRDKPSYTISTYFNRQGNGTYIHPDYYPDKYSGYTQNRLISFREAARLQSFKDSFIFSGSKGSLLKQIGNAVPPLLAYHIANSVKKKYNLKRARIVDLFCGAGGLSHGFKEAGYEIILGLDNFEEAIETFKNNNPESIVVNGDIRNNEIKKCLYGKIKGINIDIILGGPPCQGFSHAGKRIIDDPRNYLFREFVEIINNKKPLVFVMENVEGMLSLNKGKTYKSIVEYLKNIGYKMVAKKLNAAEFGVTQLRKRVFIIGSRKYIDDEVFPRPSFKLLYDTKNQQLDIFSESLPPPVTVEEAISDLPFIEKGLGEFRTTDPFPFGLSEYQSYMRNIISYEEFYEKRKIRLGLF